MKIENIKFKKLHKDAIMPHYGSKLAAGADLHAFLENPITIKSGEHTLIKTGISIELPDHLLADIRPRSGLAYKHGITVLNTPGTIDSDYRGDVGVILINHGKEDFIVNPNDRIAQMVILPFVYSNFIEVEETSVTERGEKGFGSSGVSRK